MPHGIERFCVSVGDIRAATADEWGIYRCGRLVAALPAVDGPKTKGRSCKLFRASDIIVRCRQHPRWTREFETNLLQAIKDKDFQDAV